MRWLILILTLPLLAGCSAAGRGALAAAEPASAAAPAQSTNTPEPVTVTAAPAGTEVPVATAAPAATATPARAALPDYGRDLQNLKRAVVELNIPYAVAQDNDGATWNAYGNRYWPTLYLIDRRGHLRYQHIGEGSYAETEAVIQALLAESYP